MKDIFARKLLTITLQAKLPIQPWMLHAKNWVVFLILFFSTLQSYYLYELGLAPLPIVGVLLAWGLGVLYFLVGLPFPKKNNLLLSAMLLGLVIAFSSLVGMLGYETKFSSKAPIGFFLGIITLISLLYAPLEGKSLPDVVKFVLVIHLAAWITQAVNYYVTGVYLDFLRPVTGEEQRFDWPAIAPAIRPTGLFNEPATYSIYIGSLLGLVMRSEVDRGKFFVPVLALISMYGSFSSLGIILAFFLTFALAFFYVKKYGVSLSKFILICSLLVILAFTIEPLSTGYSKVLMRLTNPLGETSGSTRLLYGSSEFAEQTSLMKMLFGNGLGNHDVINNAGMSGTYLLYFLGLFGVLAFLVIISTLMHDVLYLGVFAIILINASLVQHPFFWVWLSLSALISRDRRLNCYLKRLNCFTGRRND